MTIMWLNLSLVYLFSFCARYFSNPIPNQSNIIKPNSILVILGVTVLAIVSGLRKNIGDTFFYMHSYELSPITWSDIDFKEDFGFNILQMLLQKISGDAQLLILVTGIITNVLIVFVLYKYSRIFELSVYVYITSGMYTTSMNGIRQFFAAAIMFTATKYLLNGNFKKYLIIILIASTMHKSVLVLIPMYFIVRREAWSKVTFLLLISAVFIVLGFNTFSEVLFSTIGDTKYAEYENFAEGGVNFLRVIVNIVPVIVAYLGREKLRSLWPQSDYIVNMTIISTVFIIIASQNWIFARFNIYFGLYGLLLISWVPKLFRDKDGKLIYYAIILFYFIFYFYEHVLSFDLQYESNYLSW
jgi:transmembrane protein EpsG